MTMDCEWKFSKHFNITLNSLEAVRHTKEEKQKEKNKIKRGRKAVFSNRKRANLKAMVCSWSTPWKHLKGQRQRGLGPEEAQFWMEQTGMLLSVLSTRDRTLGALQQQTQQIHFMDLLNTILLPTYKDMLEKLDKLQEISPTYGRDLRGLFLKMAGLGFRRFRGFLPLEVAGSDLLRLVRNAHAHAQVYFGSNKLDKHWRSIMHEVFDEDYQLGDHDVLLYNKPSGGRINMVLWCDVELLAAVLNNLLQDWKRCCTLYADVREVAVPSLRYLTTPSSKETRRRRALLKRRALLMALIARFRAARECESFADELETQWKGWEKTQKDLLTAGRTAFQRIYTASSEIATRKHGDFTAEAEYEYPSLFDD